MSDKNYKMLTQREMMDMFVRDKMKEQEKIKMQKEHIKKED